MFYIDQLCALSFPIGLVKTESGYIVRSVETGLGRQTLVVAVTSVGAYPFLAFPDLTCHLEEVVTLLVMVPLTLTLMVSLLPPDSNETELGSSDKEASPSASKNTGVVLVPCSSMEVRPYCYFRWCGYF